jgi:hypothetical protein
VVALAPTPGLTRVIGKILAALGISKGITALVLLAIAGAAALGGKLWLDRLNAENALLVQQLQQARQTAADNAAVVKKLQDDQKLAYRVLADLAGDLGRLSDTTDKVTKEIIRAPTTMVCADSPAIRAVLDGLRPPAGAAAPAAR